MMKNYMKLCVKMRKLIYFLNVKENYINDIYIICLKLALNVVYYIIYILNE